VKVWESLQFLGFKETKKDECTKFIFSRFFTYMSVKHGKKYNQAVALIEEGRAYSVKEAVDLLERTNTVKFDPTIEIHFNLNIDPRQADQLVRSTITLPNGTGKTKKIAAFTDL
jgi:ribosomal protein L1